MKFPDHLAVMRRALELARQGIGFVEPNPPVGAVLVDQELNLISEGVHSRFGGPHAEVCAFTGAGGADLQRAILFVTLEPCCHTGKTPPCTDAILQAGVSEVFVAIEDPAPHGRGRGIEILREQGITVNVGVLKDEARKLIAPFTKLTTTGRPFVHAKWAMSLDGKIATRRQDSRWISGSRSREIVHTLRGRMDAIIIGIGTAIVDDPLLTARPSGPRTATRVVLDREARLPPDSQLVRTAQEVPVIDVVAPDANIGKRSALESRGIEVIEIPCGTDGHLDLGAMLSALGQRHMTNVLVEGGSGVLGGVLDAGLVDEVHVFVAPTIIGGADAPSAVGGMGVESMPEVMRLRGTEIEQVGEDVYIHGLLSW